MAKRSKNTKKLVSLRTAAISSGALAAGSAAGTAAEAALAGKAAPGTGHIAAAAVAVWFADKLDQFIDDDGAMTA